MRKFIYRGMITLVGVSLAISVPIANANPVAGWLQKISGDKDQYTKGELLLYMEEQEGEGFSDEKLKETMENYNINVLNNKFFKDIGVVYYNHDDETFELTVTTDIYKATLNAYIMGLDIDSKTWNMMQIAFAKVSETIATDMGDNYLFSIVRPNNKDMVLVYSNGEVIENNMNTGNDYVNETPLRK